MKKEMKIKKIKFGIKICFLKIKGIDHLIGKKLGDLNIHYKQI
jgi:hypothetical protein